MKTLKDIAEDLKKCDKKTVHLIYGFNGVGKTQLSREFKKLIEPDSSKIKYKIDLASRKTFKYYEILYYNAFTEDLFYWDNDLESDPFKVAAGDIKPKLKIQPNALIDWVLDNQGQDKNIIDNFQRYTNSKLTPRFNIKYRGASGKNVTETPSSEVVFSLQQGNDERSKYLKISKGEEICFIWCIFYTFLEQVVSVLNEAELSDRETDLFNNLKFVFIDDPVSSLDENHLIELAVDLAQLIKSNESNVKFIITTHNPLFYNVLCNELGSKGQNTGYKANKLGKYRLEKEEDGTYSLEPQPNDSPFSYHLYLKSEIEKAIDSGQISKYHFNFLRNTLEKTSTFLGYEKWSDLLPKTDDGKHNPYETRIINICSHSKHAGEEAARLTVEDKRMLRYLMDEINEKCNFAKAKSH